MVAIIYNPTIQQKEGCFPRPRKKSKELESLHCNFLITMFDLKESTSIAHSDPLYKKINSFKLKHLL